ncbi:MAG: hypothetical protein AB7E51_06670 [Pseudodesulfovibrio sp.]|uniref:hypothetical protein n=1 Tax=Pseudodesulfovibrio sp. TaxID=2035812 RepID=UPI003D0C6325
MIGISDPKTTPGRPEPGNLRRPSRCVDKACPSRRRCKRPGFTGEPVDFSLNRRGCKFCGYLVNAEEDNA